MIKLCSKLLLIFPLLKSAPTFTFLSLRNKISTHLPKQLQNSLFTAFSLTASTYSVPSTFWAKLRVFILLSIPYPESITGSSM